MKLASLQRGGTIDVILDYVMALGEYSGTGKRKAQLCSVWEHIQGH